MGGTLGPAHPKVPRLCRVIGWFEPGLPGGSPVRDFRLPLSRGACTPSRGRTPVYVTRLATVASHHAQRREALPPYWGGDSSRSSIPGSPIQDRAEPRGQPVDSLEQLTIDPGLLRGLALPVQLVNDMEAGEQRQS